MFPTPLELKSQRNSIVKAWAFLWLIRFVPSTIAGLAVIAGLQLSGRPRLSSITGLAFATVFLVASGCSSWNDYSDQAVDKINVPYRPLPSGILPPTVALAYSMIAFTAGWCFAVGLGLKGVLFYLPAMVFSLTYSPMVKKITGAKNLSVGVFCGAIIAYGAYLGGNVFGAAVPVVIAVISVAAREVLIDIHDMKGDRAEGYRTIPIVFGVSYASRVAALLLAVCSVLELWFLAPMVNGFIARSALVMSGVCFLNVAIIFARGKNLSNRKMISSIRIVVTGLASGVVSLIV